MSTPSKDHWQKMMHNKDILTSSAWAILEETRSISTTVLSDTIGHTLKTEGK
jgi:hypothetical protein